MFSSQDFENDEDNDDYVSESEDDSSESETYIEEDEKPVMKPIESQSSLDETINVVRPPASRQKLLLKFSIPKKPTISQNSNDPTTSSRLEEGSSKPSENCNTNEDKEENGRMPTKIRIKPTIKLNSDVKTIGECSQTKTPTDNDVGSQKKTKFTFKLKPHVENPINANKNENLMETDSSEDVTLRTRLLKVKASSCETNDSPQNNKLRISFKSSKNNDFAKLIPFNTSTTTGSGSKSDSQLGKTNWLLLLGEEEGCRYIPQLGDEVVYFRQVHAIIYITNKLS